VAIFYGWCNGKTRVEEEFLRRNDLNEKSPREDGGS
jgi:hypothetical protein